MKPADCHPVAPEDTRCVGDDARWLRWRALCTWTFRLWGLMMAWTILALHWLSEDLSRMIVRRIVTAASTLAYREIVLFHWAYRLRIRGLILSRLQDQAAVGEVASGKRDDHC
ncbi:MAG TPA: hypothetical protein VD886_02095 [Herpetosiphonaceae bacterium]|nr:hypothetical protein [Herpetosiphonaceae bacterium]